MITIVQHFDEYYKKLAYITYFNKMKYAEKYGHIFISYESELTNGDDWYWHNTLGVLKSIEDTRSKGEWIFWTDVDSLIMNFDFDIEALTKNIDDEVQIIASMWILPSYINIADISRNISIIYSTKQDFTMYQIHTGNFLIRRSHKAVKLLEKIYRDTRFRERPEIIIPGSGDEAAYAIYYNAYPKIKKMFKLLNTDIFCTVPPESTAYFNRFNMLSKMRINEYKPGDFILHVIGRWDDLEDIANWKYNILRRYV